MRVTLAQELGSQLEGSETVFVFARDAQGGGPPLAVYRTRVEALPATVVLDDSMSMVPSIKLSDRERVVVTARVSLSGEVRAGSGDLQGSTASVTVGNESPVDLVINERVP